jgi:hypothetical protein
MSSDTTAALPMWGGPWTGPDGSVHINNASQGRTFCGLNTTANGARPIAACSACVAASLASYAVNHTCTSGCRR